ncbi:YbfB/YjiJ family MFS transporter [Rathayibacter sp. VKM Ac-2856]|uniref:MFS transporter n=1 Tax=unclassified Rathayibacter TaxID=2609250 RepID=UPI001564B927|nr:MULTISPECIES: MFS transporter [unclassified Rathayibacter]NQX03288.1 YbfB/YjiJ family MFS transporter [Rathayibacter sp. VKM Ac-2858]NQX18456.1 YbfB/YjiJ family MFS transporter [Rathayibacter sp. VKM Ac-2856]
MKRSFSLAVSSPVPLIVAATGLIAAAYGLVRFAYGLLLPEMRAELGFDAATAGAVSAGASVAYCLGAVAGFVLASRAARLLVLAAGATAGAGSLGMALSHEFAPFAIAAVVSSIGAGLASPALVDVLRRGVRPGLQSRAQTIANSGTGPGLIGAGALALTLLPDWRAVWVVAAIAAVATALAVTALDGTAARRETPAALSTAWLRAHRGLILAAALLGAGSAGVWNYGRTLLVDEGSSTAGSVVAWVVLGVGGTAAIATARWTSTLSPRTAWTITTATAAAGTLGLALAAGTPLALVACLLFGWGYTAGTGALIAWTASLDPERAATGTALLFVVLIAGQAVGAIAIGALLDGPGAMIAFTVAAVATLAAGAARRGRRVAPTAATATRSCPQDEQLARPRTRAGGGAA